MTAGATPTSTPAIETIMAVTYAAALKRGPHTAQAGLIAQLAYNYSERQDK